MQTGFIESWAGWSLCIRTMPYAGTVLSRIWNEMSTERYFASSNNSLFLLSVKQ